MKAYRYVFYKLYTWFRKSDVAEYKALAGVYLLITFNLLTVPQIMGIIGGKKVFLPDFPRTTLLLIALGHLLIHYFLLVFNNRYVRIVKEFQDENEKQKKKGNRFVFLYIAGSILGALASLYIESLGLGS